MRPPFLAGSLLLIGALLLGGCAGRPLSDPRPAALRPPTGQRSPAHNTTSQSPDPWHTLSQLQRGQRVAVYFQDGRRLVDNFRYRQDLRLALDKSTLELDRLALITRVPPDPSLNGVLLGAGIGAGLVGGGLALSDSDDFAGGAVAAATLVGAGIGAALGALLDAAVPQPEEPLGVREPATQAGSRHWNIRIAPGEALGWVTGRTVHIMLKSGDYLRGTVVEGTAEQLGLRVKESNRKELASKRTDLPLADIATIIYRESLGGNRGAAALGGGLAGALGGAWAGALSSDAADEGPAAAAGAIAGGVLGAAAAAAVAHQSMWREVTLSLTEPPGPVNGADPSRSLRQPSTRPRP